MKKLTLGDVDRAYEDLPDAKAQRRAMAARPAEAMLQAPGRNVGPDQRRTWFGVLTCAFAGFALQWAALLPADSPRYIIFEFAWGTLLFGAWHVLRSVHRPLGA